MIYKNEVYEIIGACMEVHSVLGHGFHESVYQEAVSMEFIKRGISFQKEVLLEITYKGTVLRKKYFADFVCNEKIIVEFKACSALLDAHMGQVINYLKVTNMRLGVLVNFGSTSLVYRRIVL